MYALRLHGRGGRSVRDALIVLVIAGVVLFVAVGVFIVWVVIGAARISAARARADRRGGMVELDTPSARKRIGQPW